MGGDDTALLTPRARLLDLKPSSFQLAVRQRSWTVEGKLGPRLTLQVLKSLILRSCDMKQQEGAAGPNRQCQEAVILTIYGLY